MKIQHRSLFSLVLFLFVATQASICSALCVKADHATLRSGPGLGYPDTWLVYKYMPFRELGARGSWIKVQDLEGDSHWIHRSLVTSTMLCAAVKKYAHLRSGPTTQALKLDTAQRYTSFRVLKERDGWYKVLDENQHMFWVSAPLVWTH